MKKRLKGKKNFVIKKKLISKLFLLKIYKI